MASPSDDQALSRRLTQINHILLVLSGKGGVGKSSVAVQLVLSLLHERPNSRIGLLDIDLTGPSIPRMLGLQGRSVHQSTDGWVPVQTNLSFDPTSATSSASGGLLKCMSIGFLLKDPKDSVVWRGPKKNAMIKQFLCDVRWGDLDWLIIDTPPGTSDEHISLLEQLSPLLTSSRTLDNMKLPTLSSVLVTTPQAVSLSDVSKEFDFTKKTGLKVIGLIENMSGYLCPHCGTVQNVFGSGGGQAFCEKISAQTDKPSDQLKFLGKVPIDVEFMKLMDQALKPGDDGSALHQSTSIEQASSQSIDHHSLPSQEDHLPRGTQSQHLMDRYAATATSKIFGEICRKITELIESSSRGL